MSYSSLPTYTPLPPLQAEHGQEGMHAAEDSPFPLAWQEWSRGSALPGSDMKVFPRNAPADVLHSQQHAYDPHHLSLADESHLAALVSPADAMARFFNSASSIHQELDTLNQQFDTVRTLSERLRVLHPNDFSTPRLALDLRDALKSASLLLVHLDSAIVKIYNSERKMRIYVKLGRINISEEDLFESKEEVNDLLVRFVKRRVGAIKREARAEKREREQGTERKSPAGLDDYLACEGISEVQNMMRKDSVPASRFIVTNPFSILARLTNGMESLDCPKLVALPPGSSKRSKKSKPVSSNPTPMGQDGHSMPDWKRDALRGGTSSTSKSHRFFDTVAHEVDSDLKKLKQRRMERWVLCLTLALIPALLLVYLVEEAVRATSSAKSGFSSVPATLMNNHSVDGGSHGRSTATTGSGAFLRARSTYV